MEEKYVSVKNNYYCQISMASRRTSTF